MSGSLWHCIGSHCNLIVKDGKKYIERKTWAAYVTCFSSVMMKHLVERASFLSFQPEDKRSWKLNRERSHKKSDKPERNAGERCSVLIHALIPPLRPLHTGCIFNVRIISSKNLAAYFFERFPHRM